MAWVVLVAAGLLEIGWALLLKQSDGFSRGWPTIGFGVLLLASVYLLSLALRTIPLGIAYAVWTGIGAIGAVIVGIVYFGEDADIGRLVCISLILMGIVGLKLSSPH